VDQTQTAVRTIVKDTTPPRLIITQPGTTFGIGAGGCTIVPGAQLFNCTVSGATDPDAILTINNIRYKVDSAGFFQQDVQISYDQATIEIAATDSMGNRVSAIITRAINVSEIGYVEITVSPSTIVANGTSTAVVTVNTMNILKQPINAAVTLSATPGGSLASNAFTTSGGVGSTTFTAGVGSIQNPVTITAASGAVSSTAILLLTPDKPPTPGKINEIFACTQ